MVATAERDGEVALPFLTQADLCAFGAAHQSLICERTWQWWTGLGDDRRADLTTRSLETLARRGLIGPGTGDLPPVPAPELGLILASRIRAETVVTCQVPGRDPGFEPRFFGIPRRAGGPRAALVRETLTAEPSGPDGRADFGTILRYSLMTPSSAAQAIDAWVHDALVHGTGVRDGGVHGQATAAEIDMFGHVADGGLSRDHLGIRPAGGLLDIYRPAGDTPRGGLDRAGLRRLLTAMLTGAG